MTFHAWLALVSSFTPHQSSDLPALEEAVYQAVEDGSGVLRCMALALEVGGACPSVGTRSEATGFEDAVGGALRKCTLGL